MADKKYAILGASGRQAAYTAKNRAALIQAAQQTLAEYGTKATIEQLVNKAQVSPNTIYNYFESKEQLFREAFQQLTQEFLVWAYDGTPEGENFQDFINVFRKLLLVGQTHPMFRDVLSNTAGEPTFLFESHFPNFSKTLKQLVLRGEIPKDNFEERALLWSYCLYGIVGSVLVRQTMTVSEAEKVLELSLALWGLSPEQSRKLVAKPQEKQ